MSSEVGGPRPRAALDGIPSYKPGRAPATPKDRPTFKLSSNENAFPPPAELIEAVQRATTRMNRYPDLACGRLAAALSERLGVPSEELGFGTGSVALIYHLIQAMCEPGDEVVYAWRSFEAYPIAAQVPGAVSVQVPNTTDARHDLDAMAAAITDRTRVVLVCTPNNPTGPIVTHDELTAFCARVPSNVLIVLDEAYLQFVRDPNAADGLAIYREFPNVCLMRTFSKAFSLAGFRVGYALARSPVIDGIRACTPPFPVSGAAEEAALAALDCEEMLADRVEQIVKERSRVCDGLRDQGWDVPATEANFFWLRLGERTDEFAQWCEGYGVVVRPFSGDGCRISVGEPEANDLILKAAADWRAR